MSAVSLHALLKDAVCTSFRMILSDFSKIFNDTKQRADSLQQLSFLYLQLSGTVFILPTSRVMVRWDNLNVSQVPALHERTRLSFFPQTDFEALDPQRTTLYCHQLDNEQVRTYFSGILNDDEIKTYLVLDFVQKLKSRRSEYEAKREATTRDKNIG